MKLNQKKNVGKTMSAKLLLGVFCQNYKDWMHHYQNNKTITNKMCQVNGKDF
jgi:hypothetical protein